MKKILSIVMCALLAVSVLAISAFAAEEPTVTNDTKVYISFQAGDNVLDGLASTTPKKQLLSLEDNGVISVLKDGGTLVAVGKLFIGGNYVMPTLGSPVLITSNDGETDFKNPLPDTNPDCAMKIAKGATLTITSDIILDDIILFQEHADSNTIEVTNGATLVIGENIVCLSNPNLGGTTYNSIVVREGCTAIVKAGTFEYIAGEGEIIVDDDVTIVGEAPEVLPTAIPAETEATEEVVTSESVESTEPAESAETADTVEATEETTEATTEATTKATTKATTEGTTEAATEEPVTEPDNTMLYVGIAAAVILVAVIVVVVIKKKK